MPSAPDAADAMMERMGCKRRLPGIGASVPEPLHWVCCSAK